MADSKMSSTTSVTGGQSPSKKHKRSKDLTSNPLLPDDLIVSILARVSKSYYPYLSLVSKSFRSILASPQLNQTRTLLGKTDNLLYVCLSFPDEANPRWFNLYRKPNKTLTLRSLTNQATKKKKKETSSSVNLLVSISILNPPLEWSEIISVGHNLYGISEDIEEAPYYNVPFLDCRTHTWHEAPRMRLAHTSSVLEGRMYFLPGSFEKLDSLNCVEVYNTKTQTSKPVPPEKRIFELDNLEGKVYYKNFDLVSGGKDLDLWSKSKQLTCGLDADTKSRSSCLIENITYCYWDGNFVWREIYGIQVYHMLKGLEGLLKFSRYCTVKLVDYGGKLVVLWDKYVPASGYKEKMIWCAEISLEKRDNNEIWGKVEWFDAVLMVPKSYKILCATAATL